MFLPGGMVVDTTLHLTFTDCLYIGIFKTDISDYLSLLFINELLF